jgi:hypothetical protein
VGRAQGQSVINAAWRAEGLAVLLWALKRFDLPRYDEGSVENIPAERIGLLSSVAEADRAEPPVLRLASEFDEFASHMTITSWRLTQFRASRDSELYQQASQYYPQRTGIQEPMDFLGYLRGYPNFKESWLEGLRFIDGDLAIGDRSIAAAEPEEVKRCTSIATERQIAAFWLQGDHAIYSKVVPATLLSAC